MAKSISEEELQLRKRARRRLVGAIALVTIIAVLLPMVLDHEPKPVSQDVSIKIPSPDSGAFTSKIVPVAPAVKAAPAPAAKSEVPAQAEAALTPAPKPETPKAAAASAAKAAPVSVPPAYDTEAAPPRKAADKVAAVAPAKPLAKPVVDANAKAAETPKPAEKIKPAVKGAAGYVVQVAALNDADKARQMRDQITAAGVKAYTEVVPTAKGNVTRVRAGPFTARGDADKARDKLKALGLSGNVIPK
ncbi:MAG: SPOR domain-containing protein [Burkholderiales bacterium]